MKTIQIKGLLVDNETICEHYNSPLDIVAIKFKCYDTFYPCYQCHSSCEDHIAERWQVNEFSEKAILCGHCKEFLTITEYLNTDICPYCKAKFNPKCSSHYAIYFEM